jgi:hypothetical protein
VDNFDIDAFFDELQIDGMAEQERWLLTVHDGVLVNEMERQALPFVDDAWLHRFREAQSKFLVATTTVTSASAMATWTPKSGGSASIAEVGRSITELSIEIDIPDEFCCPISKRLMSDPVMCGDGQTYERKDIEQWLALPGEIRSPMTSLPILDTVTPNINLRHAIEAWKHNSRSQLSDDSIVVPDYEQGRESHLSGMSDLFTEQPQVGWKIKFRPVIKLVWWYLMLVVVLLLFSVGALGAEESCSCRRRGP